MMAKISLGNSFSATVNYVLNENKNAELIDSQGIRTKDKQTIIDSFSIQQSMRADIAKPVYHISLDFSSQDSDKITNELMAKIAEEYLRKMNITNTQYIAVRHNDKEHPHIHLCINRIDNNGKLISTRYDHSRNESVCKELTKKYGLYYSSGKERVKRERLRGRDKVKYEIYDTLKVLVPQSNGWHELSDKLKDEDIHLKFVHKGKTTEIQGVTFSKNGYSFNGSKIDREFSYSKINQQIRSNNQPISIRENPKNETDSNQGKSFENERRTALPDFKNIYSEEENTSNNRKRKRRL